MKKLLRKKYLNLFYYLFVVLFFCFLVVNGLVGKSISAKFQLLVVSSDSMEPRLPQSTLILLENKPDYKVDEIVTFTQENTAETVTHRVVDKKMISQQYYFLTKGDGNEVADGWVEESRILGKVSWTGLRLLGALIYLQSNDFLAQLIIIWLPLIIIVVIESKKIYQELK